MQNDKLKSTSEEILASKTNKNKENSIDEQLLKLLTKPDIQYLKDHPVIIVQYETNHPPFNYTENGKPVGHSIDFMELISKKMGVEIKYIENKFRSDNLKMLKEKQLDAMINIVETAKNQEDTNFNPPYTQQLYITEPKLFDNLNGDIEPGTLLRIVTHKTNHHLTTIVKKTINIITEKELTTLRTKWLEQITKKIKISLTPDEEALLKSKEFVSCYNNGPKWKKLILFFAQPLGMKVDNSKNLIWSEALKALQDGTCDFLPEVTETEERKKIMNFTPTFHQVKRGIVTLIEQGFIENIEDFLHKKFAVVKGDILIDQLKEAYPNIKLELIDSQINGLRLVKSNKVFASIGSISTVGKTITNNNLENIKISGVLPSKFNNKYSIATRKEDKLLNSIFTKMVNAADKKMIREILFSDFKIKIENNFDYTLFWRFLFIALLILAAITYWNRHLSTLYTQLKAAKLVAEEAQQTIIIQEKMSSLGTLTAGVAHEINNPINFIHAAVFMMNNEIIDIKAFLKQLAGGDNADEKVLLKFEDKFLKLIKLIDTASEGTNRIKGIVSDLQLFSRFDTSKQEETNLATLIQSTVHLVKTQYNMIDIYTDLNAEILVTCFPAKLNQVFMNIIVNACQAIETKKQSNDKLIGKIKITLLEEKNRTKIIFKDNGCGMDKTIQKKIFDPFFTTKVVGEGTGLGMAISFGIIEEHGGYFEICSNVNKGSVITVCLPNCTTTI